MQTSAEIERLKTELDTARIERKNLEECETIRETVAAQPSRAQSIRSIEDSQREIAEMEREIAATALAVEHRKKQFSLLMHVVSSAWCMLPSIQPLPFLLLLMLTSRCCQSRDFVRPVVFHCFGLLP